MTIQTRDGKAKRKRLIEKWEFVQCTANAINSAKTTIEGLDKLKTYVETSVKNSKTLQESIGKNLEHAKDIISKSLDEIFPS